MRRVLAVGTLLTMIGAISLVTAAPASAGTVQITGTTLTFTGVPTADTFDPYCNGSNVLAEDDTTINGGPIQCDDLTQVLVNLDAGDDSANMNGLGNAAFTSLGSITVNGGDGSDTLFGSSRNDTLNGEAGNDVMFGRGGVDQYAGGADTDRIVDATGFTNITLTDTTVTVTGAGGNDTMSSVEAATLSASAAMVNTFDTTAFSGGVLVTTNDGNDTVTTGPGEDLIIESNGASTINSGGGNDQIYIDGNGADGAADAVDGASGLDTVIFRGDNLVIGPASTTSSNAGTMSTTAIEDLYVQHTEGTSTAAAWNGTISWLIQDLNGIITGSPQSDTFIVFDGGTGGFNGGAGKDVIDILLDDTVDDVTVTNNEIQMTDDVPGLTIVGHAGTEKLTTEPGAPGMTIDVSGYHGTTKLVVDEGNNVVKGSAQKDVIQTGAGQDKILAGAGNDKMNGGTQKDTCQGGPGRDRATSCEKGRV